MFIDRSLTGQFDGLIKYASQINRLNGGTGMALIVIQHDRVVAEHYEGTHSRSADSRPVQADSQFNVASARKSYIAFAAALAVYEGKIASIDDLVTDYLPELDHELMRHTTIRHLLTHTHGIEYEENGRLYREFEPGTSWAYRSANIIMLTQIIERTMGRTVSDILRESVFRPLGFEETAWRTTPCDKLVEIIADEGTALGSLGLGTNATGAGDQRNLYVSAREFAYWGYFHLRRGLINGNQIAPPEVFDLITSVRTPPLSNVDLPQNGFLWYVKGRRSALSEIGDTLPNGTYQILGVTGPLVLVIPKYDAVVVRMYNKRGNYGGHDGSQWLQYLKDFGDQVRRTVQ
jgi:CubicO group peptidase (beta-lactamase class C family)